MKTNLIFSIFIIIPHSFSFYNTRHTQIYSYQNTEVKRQNIGTWERGENGTEFVQHYQVRCCHSVRYAATLFVLEPRQI